MMFLLLFLLLLLSYLFQNVLNDLAVAGGTVLVEDFRGLSSAADFAALFLPSCLSWFLERTTVSFLFLELFSQIHELFPEKILPFPFAFILGFGVRFRPSNSQQKISGMGVDEMTVSRLDQILLGSRVLIELKVFIFRGLTD